MLLGVFNSGLPGLGVVPEMKSGRILGVSWGSWGVLTACWVYFLWLGAVISNIRMYRGLYIVCRDYNGTWNLWEWASILCGSALWCPAAVLF